jgi:hypothetical protein
MAMKPARPALRIFDNRFAQSFYLDWLAFQLNWKHCPQDGGPSIMEVKRDDTTLVLSEHYGDGTPGTKVFIEIDDLDSLHQELTARHNPYMRPGIEDVDWGRILTVIDPFGNKLVFVAKAISKQQEA